MDDLNMDEINKDDMNSSDETLNPNDPKSIASNSDIELSTGDNILKINGISDDSIDGDGLSKQHIPRNPEDTCGIFSDESLPVSREYKFDHDKQDSEDIQESNQYTTSEIPSHIIEREQTQSIEKETSKIPSMIDNIDPDATQVTPSVFVTRPCNVSTDNQGKKRREGNITYSIIEEEDKSKNVLKQAIGCLFRIGLAVIIFIILLVVGGTTFLIYKYFSISATLPDVKNLREHASQFETTRILDRNGDLLYELIDPSAGRRTYVTFDNISPYVIAATIAIEDKEYFNHPGFDPIAIMRALWQNYTSGEVVSGASTITQQLARTFLLTPEERSQITTQRKAREIVLAAEITRLYTKEEILELYLNEMYYGNLAYGIEAAAETYFNTTAGQLNLAQSSFLAGLLQAPGVYDIFSNREQTLNRHRQGLILIYEVSQEKGCIDVSNNIQPICVDSDTATQALYEIENYEFTRHEFVMHHPHWVNYIRAALEKLYDPQTIYRSGFTVYTTLDPILQDKVEKILREQVALLNDRNVTDGALVVIRPSSGEILAMVGSADYYNESISGQVNMAIQPRQPGSAIKPLTYIAAFEKGWTPGTLIWDVPSEFPPSGQPDDTRPPYKPVNYDERFHGPVTVRSALANSYNVPAVKTLQFVGVYDNPETPERDGLINFAKRLGISTLIRDDYGLSLTLGGGEVTLLELTSAYATFANGGKYVPPMAIQKIIDFEGNIVYEYQQNTGEQVIRSEHAFLISSILSDNDARTPMFGSNSVLNLPFQVAVKTGTTNDFRDNWTIGYIPEVTIGVWVGNADYTPMENTTGLTGAAPILAQAMQEAVQEIIGHSPMAFVSPPGVMERLICTVSGSEPSELCPSQRREYFAYDQPPRSKEEDLWQQVRIDSWTGNKANLYCTNYIIEKFALNVTDPWAIKWITNDSQGKAWAEKYGFKEPIFFTPQKECSEDEPGPDIEFANLSDGQLISETPLDVYAIISASQYFKEWRLEYGLGQNPDEWKILIEHQTNEVDSPEMIYSWDLSGAGTTTVTLRIYLDSINETFASKEVHLDLQIPTPTPTVTSSPLPTQTPTITPSLSPTLDMTVTPTSTIGPTESPTPSATASPTSS